MGSKYFKLDGKTLLWVSRVVKMLIFNWIAPKIDEIENPSLKIDGFYGTHRSHANGAPALKNEFLNFFTDLIPCISMPVWRSPFSSSIFSSFSDISKLLKSNTDETGLSFQRFVYTYTNFHIKFWNCNLKFNPVAALQAFFKNLMVFQMMFRYFLIKCYEVQLHICCSKKKF